MKRTRTIVGSLAAMALLFALAPRSGADETASPPADEAPPGSITFVGKNAVATANGVFHSWRVASSRVDFTELSGSYVDIEVDVASLDTNIVRRDDHLRSADFFEVERWPTATARVHGVRADGRDEDGRARYEARFELRIRDVTKTVPGSFTVTTATTTTDGPVKVEGSLTIDRNGWGVGKPKQRFNPMSIGDEIAITFRAELPAPDPDADAEAEADAD